MKPGTWATQVEAVALTAYFQVPVYIFNKEISESECHKPLPEIRLISQERVMVLSGMASQLKRFELLYHLQHYDAILPTHDQPSLDAPFIRPKEIWMALDQTASVIRT